GCDVAAPRAATECHRRRQRSRESDSAMRRRRIDDDARGWHLASISNSRFARTCVHACGVSHAAVAQDFKAPRRTALDSLFDVESQNRRELLHRERMLAPYASDIRQQTARAWWNVQASQLRNYFNRLANDCRIQRALRRGDDFRKLICFRR